jgi:DNA-binding NtrC family response regulator/tetratricopeptide (TPR) repeat protein
LSTIDLGPRYRIIRELGSGGMGHVFLVRDLHLRKELALKLLHEPGGREDVEEWKKEFSLLARIEHPAIARAHDFGYAGSRPYYTSEFIPGSPLSERGPIASPADLIQLAAAVAAPLAFLHRSEILHLDVKPSNIIVNDERGHGGPPAVLIDFGLVRRGIPEGAGTRVRGSLPYMAPEYFRGGNLGPWTDVYALGVTLYRLATGAFPRAGPAREGCDRGSAWTPVILPPAEKVPSLHADIGNVILKCLALDPRARFPSACEVLEALERAAGERTTASRQDLALAPAVGRTAELAKVDAFLDAVERGDAPPAALLVTGPAGMGQTHLFREMKVRAQTRGLRFYLESGFAGRSAPPGSVLRPLGEHMGRSASRARRRWEAFLTSLGRLRGQASSDASEGERRLRRAGEVALAAASVRETFIIAVDRLEFLDETSITLLVDLVRCLGEREGRDRPPIGVAAGYREEGPCAPLLRELSEYLLAAAKGWTLTLGPLDLEASTELYEKLHAGGAKPPAGLSLYTETGGSPARIVALASRDRGGASLGSRGGPVGSGEGSREADAAGRELLLTLDVLGRPATVTELCSLLGWPPRHVRRVLEALNAGRLVRETDGAPRGGWVPEAAARSFTSPQPAERRAAHRRIARSLLASSLTRRERDPRLPEAVRHFQAAGMQREAARHGLLAARFLRSSLENRAALAMYRAVLEGLPARRWKEYLEVALEAAELQARVGEVDEGIRMLGEDLLSRSRRLPRTARARVVLRLAALHSRRGDFERADLLFEEGFAAAGKAARLSIEEHLRFLNEHAAMKAVTGRHAEAVKLCGEGLRLAGRGGGRAVRESVLNLHATRANIALREYDYAAAIRDFETALRTAAAIGSPANQATILNNLGVVYSQCDRYQDAIDAFRESERICLRLDEGPSLVSIRGNLAILHAKLGDFTAAERALREAERLAPAALGRRQDLFLKHARGLFLLSCGRHAQAHTDLEAAVRLADEVGDRHLAAFDEVYLAEALIFQGSYAEARRRLESLCAPPRSARVRRMALARLAFLEALTGQRNEARRTAAAHARLAPERSVPFLDAWESLYVGWALAIAGEDARALGLLEAAGRFFSRQGLLPARYLACAAMAELLLLRGDTGGARAVVALPDGTFPPRSFPQGGLAAVILPLVCARILLDAGTLRPEDREVCSDLLAEAGAALVGNQLPEWAAILDGLRGALDGGERHFLRAAERRREQLARGLRERVRPAYLESPRWRVWVGKLGGNRVSRNLERPPPLTSDPATSTRTVALGEDQQPSRRSLITRSPAMRRVLSILDRIRDTDLPVLISGETGTGKELIARRIHAESRRAGRPFQVLDCATIPLQLLEAELFGARAGAFTGLHEDRHGILTSAGGGTVFVDEIGGVPLEVQAKLLRAISARTMRPLGGNAEQAIRARFIFSTAKDLAGETEAGRFRRDLLHRIQVVTIQVPPLRERPEDVPELVQAFLAGGIGPAPAVAPDALDRLRELPWPGNVRQLENLIARLRLESPDRITLEALDRIIAGAGATGIFPPNVLAAEGLPLLKERLEREYILHHFHRLGRNTDSLARFLGLRRRQLYRRCERLRIRLKEERRRD